MRRNALAVFPEADHFVKLFAGWGLVPNRTRLDPYNNVNSDSLSRVINGSNTVPICFRPVLETARIFKDESVRPIGLLKVDPAMPTALPVVQLRF